MLLFAQVIWIAGIQANAGHSKACGFLWSHIIS